MSPLLRNNNIAAACVTSDICLPGSDLRYLIVYEISTHYKRYKSTDQGSFKRGIDTWNFQRKVVKNVFPLTLVSKESW
jgi:hypothetical protein